MKRDLVGGEWRRSGGDSSETGSLTEEGKQKSTASINASLTPDFRDKKESNVILKVKFILKRQLFNKTLAVM